MALADFSRLNPVVAKRLKPLVEKMVRDWGDGITHLCVVGSATTPDFDEKVSDINTLAVLSRISFSDLGMLAEAGAGFGQRGLAAPMLFTRVQIERSLDVFPVEFLTFRLHHQCILGDDLLAGIEIGKGPLRMQLERELRRILIRMNHDYLRARGDRKLLEDLLRGCYSAILPLLTALVYMKGEPIPEDRAGLTAAACRVAGIDQTPLASLEQLRRRQIKPDVKELTTTCEQIYAILEKLTDVVDALKA